MTKKSREHLAETERLNKDITTLQQQLKEAREYIKAIKTDNIDALVVAHEKALKVYTEKTSDKPYRILIEKMHEGAVTLNEDGIILYCNSSFAKLVNLPIQKIIGTLFENFIDDTSKEHFKALLKQSDVNVLNEEVLIYTGDGKQKTVLMTANVLSLDNVFVLSIILTDLTVQIENQEKLRLRSKQLEQKNRELEILNKELAFQIEEKERREAELSIAETDVKELEGLNTHKESVLATLSHDLRGPLAGIIQTIELLKNNFDTLDRNILNKMLDLLYKAATDELSMLDYLVEWARIKYASEAFSPANIMLVKYVKKVFETLNDIAVVNNIHFHHEIDESINVYADEKMLISILQNIVSNSIKHIRAGGNITVMAKRKKDKIIIEVKDTGTGMSKEVIEKLFTPQMMFLSKSRKENKGAGIGLLLVKGFLEKHGGEIWAESAEGVGTSFYFTLFAENTLDKMVAAGNKEFAENS